MADVADVSVERFDVVAVRIEQVSRVVAGGIVAIAGRAVATKASLGPGVIEGINLIPAPGVEAQVEVPCRGTPINDVQVREARRS